MLYNIPPKPLYTSLKQPHWSYLVHKKRPGNSFHNQIKPNHPVCMCAGAKTIIIMIII